MRICVGTSRTSLTIMLVTDCYQYNFHGGILKKSKLVVFVFFFLFQSDSWILFSEDRRHWVSYVDCCQEKLHLLASHKNFSMACRLIMISSVSFEKWVITHCLAVSCTELWKYAMSRFTTTAGVSLFIIVIGSLDLLTRRMELRKWNRTCVQSLAW